MQFCLGTLNNVLYVFLLKFSSFTRYYVCKKACICGLISNDRKDIDLLQRVTLKSVDFRVKPLQFDFMLTCDRKDVNYTQITAQN